MPKLRLKKATVLFDAQGTVFKPRLQMHVSQSDRRLHVTLLIDLFIPATR